MSPVVLAVDGEERVYVVARSKNYVLVYDGAGRLSKMIGSRAAASAAGSAEFRAIDGIDMVWQVLVGQDGRVFVADGHTKRTAVLSRDLRLLSSARSPLVPSMILRDGTFLAARQVETPDLIGFPLHVINRQGTVLRSFGAAALGYRVDQPLYNERVVGSGREGTIWAAAPGRYEFERWDPARGVAVERVRVASTWFVASAAWPRVTVRPNSIVVALWEREGVLWVLTRTADAQWKLSTQRGERALEGAEYDAKFDWILEAVDPASASVLAHRRFAAATFAAAPHFLVSRTLRSRGGSEIVLSSVGLTIKEK